jgi:sulfatase maturation enzyme AslB (radical SAM superfamily)
MNIDKDKFCIVPFVQLNTRGKGDARVCCSISGTDFGIPTDLTLDEINPNTYNKNTSVYNLSYNKIEDLWNSKFMKDFRMKMLNGETISNCSFCHRMEASGLGSKRVGKNKKFFEKVLPYLEKYYTTNGYVDVMPQWWEIRLSTKCNLSCIMCSPNLSSMMYKEYTKWGKNMTPQMQGSLEIAKSQGGEYLSESEFFKNQIKENLKHVLYMEFRGGEDFADRHSINFIWEIANTEFAKNIYLDISTNATLITDEIIQLLNCFAGGLLRFSIDSYKYQDELIRYHTDWDSVISSIENTNNLHQKWEMVTQTCIQALNCVGITELLYFLDDYCKTKNNSRFHLGFTTVRGKEWMRHELVPAEYRSEEILKLKKFIASSWLCNESPNKSREIAAIDGLITALSADTNFDQKLNNQAKQYYKKLNELRSVDYWEIFPHLEYLNKEEL